MERPLQRIVSDGGGLWGLSEEAYVMWWRRLPPADRETFQYLGGDDELGRFCAAYDLLSTGEGEHAHTLVRAWAIATGKSEDDHHTKLTALRAWENPAVRELLDRLASRETERAERRIARATSLVIEESLTKALDDETSLDNRAKVVMAATRFLSMTATERNKGREIRALLENEALKKSITAKPQETDDEEITPEIARRYFKALVHVLGPEEIKSLVSGDGP